LFKCHHDKSIAHKKVVVKYFLIALLRKDSEGVNLLKKPGFFTCKPLKTRGRKNQSGVST
jgi:hypothetical protein